MQLTLNNFIKFWTKVLSTKMSKFVVNHQNNTFQKSTKRGVNV